MAITEGARIAPRHLGAMRIAQLVALGLALAIGAIWALNWLVRAMAGAAGDLPPTILSVLSAVLLFVVVPLVLAAIPLLERGRAGRIASIVVAGVLAVYVVAANPLGAPVLLAEAVAACLPARRAAP